jgi:hypothetical protein
MKTFVLATLALLTLGFVPQASASADVDLDLDKGPCIIYSQTIKVGGFWVYTNPVRVPGQNVDVLFIHLSTDPVTVGGGGVYVPYGTTVVTPSVCYGAVLELLAASASAEAPAIEILP